MLVDGADKLQYVCNNNGYLPVSTPAGNTLLIELPRPEDELGTDGVSVKVAKERAAWSRLKNEQLLPYRPGELTGISCSFDESLTSQTVFIHRTLLVSGPMSHCKQCSLSM